MLQILSKGQLKDMHKDIVKWFEKELERDFGSYLYNLIHQTKGMIEDVRRDKDINTCYYCNKEITPFEKYRKHIAIELKRANKQYKKLIKTTYASTK